MRRWSVVPRSLLALSVAAGVVVAGSSAGAQPDLPDIPELPSPLPTDALPTLPPLPVDEIGSVEGASIQIIDKNLHVEVGQEATVRAQVLDDASQPVPGALVFFQVSGTAFHEYEGVVTFPVWTDATGVAILPYGYRSDTRKSVPSQDVISAWALSGGAAASLRQSAAHAAEVPLSARAAEVPLSWILDMGQVSFGSAAAVDPCDDPLQCDPLGLPYTNCISPTCETPNVCNVNCDVPPDPCLVLLLCDLDIAELGPLQDPNTHEHRNYPRVPNGGSDIVQVFGNPCNPKAAYNNGKWSASDGQTWTFTYHKKLGGERASTFPDVRHHVNGQGLRKYVKSGIWGYHCRTVSGTTKYSTHSWGIAWDISASYEHYGHNAHNCHLVKWETGVPGIWENHGFYWGRNFSGNRDCMHFQYATGY